jgi:hypothetical protein
MGTAVVALNARDPAGAPLDCRMYAAIDSYDSVVSEGSPYGIDAAM